jgi:serine/threonine-protein kinase
MLDSTEIQPTPPDATTIITPPPAAAPAAPGGGLGDITAVGPYTILGELGRGGMGVVFKALDTRDERRVALKMILGTLPGASRDEQVARFDREARVSREMRHPGIVSVFEVGVHRDMPYFVMEFIEGESLEQRLAAGRLEVPALCTLMREIAVALGHAHRLGIVHRDLKPANILLDKEGHPHIADFGLARHVDGLDRITVSGGVVGTPAYMSPEQARGEAAKQGPRSDVFSLGVIFYRALTGRPAFTGGSSHVILRKVIDEDPPEPRKLDPSIPAALEAIILRCMTKELEGRYASADEVAVEIERFERGRRVVARAPGPIRKGARWLGRNRRLGAALAAIPVFTGAAIVGVSRYKEARRSG